MATYHVWASGDGTDFRAQRTAVHTIRAALRDPRVVAGDTIRVWGGDPSGGRHVYHERLIVSRRKAGVKLVGENWPIIRSPAAGFPVISFRATALNRVTVLKGFEIHGARNNGRGGGILVWDHSVKILRNCIHDNEAGSGAGICVVAHRRPRDCTIEENHVHHNRARTRGGGIHFFRFPHMYSRTWVCRKNRIAENTAGTTGGGIGVERVNLRSLYNHIFNNKARVAGGGIAIFNTRATRRLRATLLGNFVEENSVTKDGGGVVAWGLVDVNYRYNTIEANHAFRDGGGTYGGKGAKQRFAAGNNIRENLANRDGGGIVHKEGVLEFEGGITGNFVDENWAQRHGGGILQSGTWRASFLLSTRDTLRVSENNAATGRGGGFYVVGEGRCLIRETIIEKNWARREGAGIYAHLLGNFTIRDSLVTRNRDTGIGTAPYSGLWVTAHDVVIRGCEISHHQRWLYDTALRARTANDTYALRVEKNLFLRNGVSLHPTASRGEIRLNEFRGDWSHHIAVHSGDPSFGVRIRNNILDGEGRTATAVVVGPGMWRRPVTRNNITGHLRSGFSTTVVNYRARRNWWGHAAGPNTGVPGQQPQGADVISPHINWTPHAAQPYPLTQVSPLRPTLGNPLPPAARPTWAQPVIGLFRRISCHR